MNHTREAVAEYIAKLVPCEVAVDEIYQVFKYIKSKLNGRQTIILHRQLELSTNVLKLSLAVAVAPMIVARSYFGELQK